MWGQHLALDVRGCDRDKVTDAAVLRAQVTDTACGDRDERSGGPGRAAFGHRNTVVGSKAGYRGLGDLPFGGNVLP